VATALLVAGSNLTFWIPSQTPFASTSSSFKVLGCSYNCRWLTYNSFQLTHVMWWHTVQLIKPWRPKWRLDPFQTQWKRERTWSSTRLWNGDAGNRGRWLLQWCVDAKMCSGWGRGFIQVNCGWGRGSNTPASLPAME